MGLQGTSHMDTVKNENEAFITQLTVYVKTRYESYGHC